jgi:uncharacterized membrane protein YcaP (DUF421 family)
MLVEPTWADVLLRGVLLAAIGMAWVNLLVRVLGLRSFSKMSSIDFVMTVAMGSLVASAAVAGDWAEMGQILAGIAALFALQWAFAKGRRGSNAFQSMVENEPVLLMEHGQVLDAALDATRVARGDLMAKLREADVTRLEDVRAVVLETTGDVSVLTGDCDDRLLEGVRRV